MEISPILGIFVDRRYETQAGTAPELSGHLPILLAILQLVLSCMNWGFRNRFRFILELSKRLLWKFRPYWGFSWIVGMRHRPERLPNSLAISPSCSPYSN